MDQQTRLRLTLALAAVFGLGATAAVLAADDAGIRESRCHLHRSDRQLLVVSPDPNSLVSAQGL